MEARKINRPTVGECEKIYRRYGIDGNLHTSTTSDLCAVIQDLEQRVGIQSQKDLVDHE